MMKALIAFLVLAICFSFLHADVLLGSRKRCRDAWGTNKCRRARRFCKYEDFRNDHCRKTCNNCRKIATVTPPPKPLSTTATLTTSIPTTGPKVPTTPFVSAGCGHSKLQTGKVIGGSDAKANSWPWQVLLTFRNKPSCGGAIIGPHWVVTAAHCVDVSPVLRKYFLVRTGEHNLNKDTSAQQEYNIEKIIVHENWNSYRTVNDIALLKLKTPIHIDEYASPVCIPDNEVAVGKDCYLTGWGKIRHPGNMHSILQQVKMPIVANHVCDLYNHKSTGIDITPGMVCAGDGGKSSASGCHGDSGGPLVCFDNVKKVWHLHGVVSHGSPRCDSDETYTVFSRISFYKKWIQKNKI